jgi:hypothetical protein
LLTGVLKRTSLVKPADQAAEGIAWAATAPELADHPGALYLHRKQLSLKGAANDQALAAKIWSISEQQTGIDPACSAVAAVSAAVGARPSQPPADRMPGPTAATSRGQDSLGS